MLESSTKVDLLHQLTVLIGSYYTDNLPIGAYLPYSILFLNNVPNRIKGIVECAPKNVFEAIWNPKYTKELSSSVDKDETIATFKDGSIVVVQHKHFAPAVLVCF